MRRKQRVTNNIQTGALRTGDGTARDEGIKVILCPGGLATSAPRKVALQLASRRLVCHNLNAADPVHSRA